MECSGSGNQEYCKIDFYYNSTFNKNQMLSKIYTSRAICQDQFLQKEQKDKYTQHKKTIYQIRNKKNCLSHQQLEQTKKVRQTLYKSKSIAKKFKEGEEDIQRGRQNFILFRKLKQIEIERKPSGMVYKSGSNQGFRKRQNESIKKQNDRMLQTIKGTFVNEKEYKKKMIKNIKEYVDLKNRMRKCRYQSSDMKALPISLKLHSERQTSLVDKKQEKQNQNFHFDKEELFEKEEEGRIHQSEEENEKRQDMKSQKKEQERERTQKKKITEKEEVNKKQELSEKEKMQNNEKNSENEETQKKLKEQRNQEKNEERKEKNEQIDTKDIKQKQNHK